GGLFALHVVTSEPESFDAYIATSAPLQWNNEAITREIRTGRHAEGLAGRFLYLTVGDLEDAEMIGSLRGFTGGLELADPEGLRWWYRVMSDESHMSVVHCSVYDGLESIFSDYRIRDVDLLTG